MFMYMNRFKIHKQFTKLKQQNANTLYIKFLACKGNRIAVCTGSAQTYSGIMYPDIDCVHLHTVETDCSSHCVPHHLILLAKV